MSCHDGTVALTATVSGGGGTTRMPPGSTNLGTDLSDDHPISFIYSADLSTKDSQIRTPDSLPEELRLDRYGELQCVTCHNPHDDTFGDFLVLSNLRSALCIKCHNLRGWTDTIHESSVAPVAKADDDYLQDSDYASVADNGCLSCHRPHSAGGPQRLFHFAQEEANCLSCHNGQVANTDLRADMDKTSGHLVQNYKGIHDIKESVDSSEQHVECIDCHNPHAIVQRVAQAPFVSGAMNAVSGVTAEGSVIAQATNQYEVCFKCHGHNPNRVTSTITRQIIQTDTIVEFDSANPSYHPITAKGANPNVPSLKPAMDEEAIIYCTDCHSSDSSSKAKGPHGSQYSPLLAYQYITDDETPEDASTYELCYRCHDRESILKDESFSKHKKHIEGEDTPCSACHDPHGISFSQGNSRNNSNLINFDTSIVAPLSDGPHMGRMEFEDLGEFRGQCFLLCHDVEHSPEDYEPKDQP